MEPSPLLSLCVIVRDGGEDLERCLRSARELVDEMVVVDTGSVDDSVARARRLGATVLERAWTEDFAAARNHGLERARGRWILVLDADELLPAVDVAALRGTLEGSARLGYFLPVVSEVGRSRPLVSSVLRLFRRSDRVRFRRRIHEQVIDDLARWAEESGRRLGHLPELRIEHSGYRPEEWERRGKAERNHRLFRRALEEDPEDAYLWSKYADSLRAVAPPGGAALQAARRGWELVSRFPPERRRESWVGELLAVLLSEWLRAGDARKALEVTEVQPPEPLGAPAYSFVAARAAEEVGELELAERWARSALGGAKSELSPERPGVSTELGWTLLSRILLRRGRPSEAEIYAARVLAADESQAEAWRLSVLAALARGDLTRALRRLGRCRHLLPEDPALRELRARVGGLCSAPERTLLANETPDPTTPARTAPPSDPVER